MSRIDNWDENERALYALGSRLLLDDIDRYREELNSGVALDTTAATDAMLAEHAARTRAMEEETRRYIASLAGDGEPAPAHKPAQGQGASPAGSSPAPASPAGSGPGRPSPSHAAELAEAELAERIKQMPMNEYAAMRAELGVQSPTDLNRLFGKTR